MCAWGIGFCLGADGTISGMHVDASSHNRKLDFAAAASLIRVGWLAPLPAEFTGAKLELRIRYRVNLP